MAKTVDKPKKDLICYCDDCEKKKAKRKEYKFKVESWLKNKPYKDISHTQKKHQKVNKNVVCERDHCPDNHLTNEDINKFDFSLDLMRKIDKRLINLEKQLGATNYQINNLQEQDLPKIRNKINKIAKQTKFNNNVASNQEKVLSSNALESRGNQTKSNKLISEPQSESYLVNQEQLAKTWKQRNITEDKFVGDNVAYNPELNRTERIDKQVGNSFAAENPQKKSRNIADYKDDTQLNRKFNRSEQFDRSTNTRGDNSQKTPKYNWFNRKKRPIAEDYQEDLFLCDIPDSEENLNLSGDFEELRQRQLNNERIDSTRYEEDNLIKQQHSIDQNEKLLRVQNLSSSEYKTPTKQEGDPYKSSGMIQRQSVGHQCSNKQCDKFGQCTCYGDGITDHTIICNLSCEITKLRKDILDLKVMIANCLSLLETNSHKLSKHTDLRSDVDNVKSDDVTWKTQATKSDSLPKNTKKEKKKCCRKKKKSPPENVQNANQPPIPKEKKRCYLSRICKYCCIKF